MPKKTGKTHVALSKVSSWCGMNISTQTGLDDGLEPRTVPTSEADINDPDTCKRCLAGIYPGMRLTRR